MTTWNLEGNQHHVLMCNGSSCMRKGGEEVTQAIREEITARNMDEVVHTSRTRCNGRCKGACVVIVYPEGAWYEEVDVDLARKIVGEHLENGQVVEHALSYVTTEKGMEPRNNRTVGIDKVKEPSC
ncbi:(2Fe-2S) ferredoxin domain-containing protein [Pseudalkalibacillus decolorationis]|uniref:(2Fe-2S) ferredoxin domain-containing protein n=1 Tax=Pseudalkalibacillus decolorationis TaxID=163879 RepID=UPI002147F3D6|nr:(2Fe-2S) ferredoxin domain-containing protein [Pseudalkalibacillus decolorationis]